MSVHAVLNIKNISFVEKVHKKEVWPPAVLRAASCSVLTELPSSEACTIRVIGLLRIRKRNAEELAVEEVIDKR